MTAGEAPQNVVDAYPLTAIQEGMLFHTIAAPRSGVFVGQFACDLEGELDVDAFRAAWDDILARHPALRTIFLWEGLDDPMQIVRGDVELPWTVEDWRDVAADERAARRESWLHADRERGFDPGDGPLMRMQLIRTGETTWHWIWTAHHLISDGWSTSIIVRELFDAYAARRSGAAPEFPPAVPFRTYVGWQVTRDRAADEAFWRQELQDFRSPTRVGGPGRGAHASAADAETAAGPRHHRVERPVPGPLAARLESITRERRITPSTVVQGAWSLLLSRMAGESDVVVGVTTSGRPPELEGIEEAVGVFINTLPLRTRVTDDVTVADWLRSVQDRHLDVRAREHSSLADVQRWSELPSGTALFESIVVFENYPGGLMGAAPESGLAMRDVAFIEQSNFPLAILFMPGEPSRVILVHDEDRITGPEAAALADRLLHVLDQLTAGLDGPLGAIEAMLPAERDRALVEWAGDDVSLDGGTTLPAMVSAAGRAAPHQPAVRDPHGETDYATLDARAATVSHALRARGVEAEVCVGLLTPRTADMIVGQQAIHRAGGAYVPLDPNYPAAHRRRVVEGTGIRLVLASDDLAADASAELEGVAVVSFSEAMAVAGAADPAPLDPPGSDDLAYVIHTSGSTGTPKGVMVTHRTLAHSTRARAAVYGDAPARFLLLSSMAFDSSVAGTFWTLGGGGTLVLPPERIEQDMQRLAELIERESVTHMLCLPTLYGLLLERATDAQLASLDTVIVAGEGLAPGVVAQHRDRCPRVRLFNEYGPTEGTVWATVQRIDADHADGPVSIGRPIPGARVHLLDAGGRPVPPGAPGELHLGGAGLARGYFADPERTAERFIEVAVDARTERLYRTGDLAAWRPDGTLDYLGRADGQLKIRGHRIEPEGVAAILRREPGIADAAVDGRAIGGGPLRLVAWIVPEAAGADSAAIDPAAIRASLRAGWSASMVPDVIVPVDALPHLANGKVDRTRLPDPESAGLAGAAVERVEPRDEIESGLAEIWRTVLDVEALGVHDDFFDLGGDSLISIRVMSRIEDRFERALPLAMLLERGTIAELADVLRGAPLNGVAGASDGTAASATGAADDAAAGTATAPVAPRHESLVPLHEGGDRTPIFCVHAGGGHVLEYRHLVARLDGRRPVFGLEPVGLDGERPPLDTIEAMAERYVEAVRSVQPSGPYIFMGHCVGATICWEMSRQLRMAGEETAVLLVIDAGPPVEPDTRTFAGKVVDFARQHPRHFAPYVMRRIRTAIRVRREAATRDRRPIEAMTPEERRMAYVDRVRDACLRAYWNYRTEPADVPILQIRSSQFAGMFGMERHLGWSRLTRDIDLDVVEALHRTMLTDPEQVEQVAAHVSARLDHLAENGL